MRVLIADDSPVLRTAVTALLANAGYQVISAEDGIEAIQLFYSERPDLVILDIQMPKMNGYMACRLIKEDWSVAHIPILILTAHDSAEDRYWSEKSGADGYLTKEALGDGLLRAIRTARASRALSELSGREVMPEQLDTVDVLARVTELLDRKLFESTIVNDIMTMATKATELRTIISNTLVLIRRFVEYDVAGIAVPAEKLLALRCDVPFSRGDLEHFRRLAVGHLDQVGSVALSPEELNMWGVEPGDLVDEENLDGLPSFFSLTLRARGEMLGTLALAARRAGAFTPNVARTLRLIEFPLSAVLDSALHHQKLLEQEARISLSSLYDTD